MTASRISTLAYALIGICLVAAAVRAASLPSGSCIAVTNLPTGWNAVEPGLVILIIASALALVAAIARVSARPTPLRWASVVLTSGELAAAIGLVVFLGARTAHYYDCG